MVAGSQRTCSRAGLRIITIIRIAQLQGTGVVSMVTCVFVSNSPRSVASKQSLLLILVLRGHSRGTVCQMPLTPLKVKWSLCLMTLSSAVSILPQLSAFFPPFYLHHLPLILSTPNGSSFPPPITSSIYLTTISVFDRIICTH